MSSPVAERTWFGIAPNGGEHTVVIRVNVSGQQSGGEWSAIVRLEGIDDREYSIAGVDSWQALQLAMRFAASRVEHHVEMGWKFYWDRRGEIATAADLGPAS